MLNMAKIISSLVNISMVFYTDTFEVCHGLTKSGEEAYREMLEKEADKILFKHQHPVRWSF